MSLIKRLRAMAKIYGDPHGLAALLNEAADKLEEQERELNTLRSFGDN